VKTIEKINWDSFKCCQVLNKPQLRQIPGIILSTVLLKRKDKGRK